MDCAVVSTDTQVPVWLEGVSDALCCHKGSPFEYFLSHLWNLRSGVEVSGHRMGSKEGGPGDMASEQPKHEESH